MAKRNALVSLVEREAPFLAFTADEEKVVCTLNNHELPARTDAVEAFINGKKYLRLKSLKTTEDWAGKYKPFLVPSVNFPNMMFCALTNHVIQKKQAVVEEHLKGRKFKMAQERFQRDEAELFEEPTIAEMEEAIANEQAEQAVALDGDASDDGSFKFEPMDELEDVDDVDDVDDAEDEEANARNTSPAVNTKRKRAAGPKAARKPSGRPTKK